MGENKGVESRFRSSDRHQGNGREDRRPAECAVEVQDPHQRGGEMTRPYACRQVTLVPSAFVSAHSWHNDPKRLEL